LANRVANTVEKRNADPSRKRNDPRHEEETTSIEVRRTGVPLRDHMVGQDQRGHFGGEQRLVMG